VPETEYSTTARLPLVTIWDFVSEMDNWAPFLPGYQSHEKQDETTSIWTLKGDAGALQRIVKFEVRVTEWAGPERVCFELKGLNEQLEGAGEFTLVPYEDAETSAEPTARSGLFTRLMAAALRWLQRLFRGTAERGADADAGPGAGMARLTFRLRVDPGGPMAPLVNAMMKPAMLVAAEDLANRIIGHLEGQRETEES
jgi:carbon monoxide dehydrogenase subunit G